MNEKRQLPVTVTRGPDEVTIEMDPEDILDLKQGEEITRVNLTMGGANVAILQKFLGGHTMPQGLPDLTQEEASGLIESVEHDHDENVLRGRIETALHGSIDRCARCKVCSNQVDAVMALLGYPPKNAN
jgi:hypothetical protein